VREHQRRAPPRLALHDGLQVGGHHRVPQAQQSRDAGRRGVGHAGVVAEQPRGGAPVQAGPPPVVLRRGGDQVRRLRHEQGLQVVGEQAQLRDVVGGSHRLGRVHGSLGVGPALVVADQPVDDVGSAREQPGVQMRCEVAVERGEHVPGTGGAGHLDRRVEPAEVEPLLGGTVPVPLPHPGDQLAVGGRLPEPMAEASAHHLIERPHSLGDEVVHQQAGDAVALESDRPVALVRDKTPEQLVPQPRQRLLPVHGLPEAEQTGPRLARPEEPRERDPGTALTVIVIGEGPAGVLDRRAGGHGGLIPAAAQALAAGSGRRQGWSKRNTLNASP
jgi:hypothetical protein